MEKKLLPGLLLSLALPSIGLGEEVIEVDPAYVAYADVPGPTRNAPGFNVLISYETCSAKGAPAGWRRAAYWYSHGEEPACWLRTSSKITVCPYGQYETTYKNTTYGTTTIIPCHEVAENNFYEIQ